MTAIKVTGADDTTSAVFETTVNYTLTSSTITANSLPDSLGAEVTLRISKLQVQGNAQQLRFQETAELTPGADLASAIWSTDIQGMPPRVEVVVTGPVKKFDLAKAPCGSKVPVVLASDWSVKLAKSEWKVEGSLSGTSEDTLEALVECG